MRSMRTIAWRTFGRLVSRGTTAFAAAAFMALAGALFLRDIIEAEGSAMPLPVLWAVSASYALPILTSLVTMRMWNDGEDSDQTDLDLVAPVPERAFALGRWVGAMGVCAIVLVLHLALVFVILPKFAPTTSPLLSKIKFVPACVILLLQTAMGVAIGSMLAAFFRSPATAATASMAVTSFLPYGLHRAMMEWNPTARLRFTDPPIQAQVAEMADGFISSGVLTFAAAFTLFAIFASSKALAAKRFVGRGNRKLKFSTMIAVASALLAATTLSMVAYRTELTFDWPWSPRLSAFSERTRHILAETDGVIRITAFADKSNGGFRAVARLMKAFAAESRVNGGARIVCETVDPRWDIRASERLMEKGAAPETILFERGRRKVTAAIGEAGERVFASAIRRLMLPAKSELVVFTIGHGECRTDDYESAMGMSTAVRALRQEGYRVATVNTVTSAIPAECMVLVSIGARTPFSAAELRSMNEFLAHGGRMLTALTADRENGAAPLAAQFGITALPLQDTPAHTFTGNDIVSTCFGDHPASGSLNGSTAVFDGAAVKLALQTDVRDFTTSALCKSGDEVLAAAAEKGGDLQHDLAIRPSRLIAIGDTSFFSNAALENRANANRDFLLNSMAWLAGLDISTGTGISGEILSLGMERSLRIWFAIWAVLILPILTAVMFHLAGAVKRRRG